MRQITCNVRVASLADTKYDPVMGVGKWTFKFDYPMNYPAFFTHTFTTRPTLMELLKVAAQDYVTIFGDTAKYHVWGHNLGDLYFEGVTIDEDLHEVAFDMGS